MSEKKQTLTVLLEAGKIDRDQFDLVLAQHNQLRDHGVHRMVGQIVIDNGFASREEVSQAVAVSAGHGTTHSTEFSALLPLAACLQYKVIPVRLEAGVLELQTGGVLSPVEVSALIQIARSHIQDRPVTSVKALAAPKDRIDRDLHDLRQVSSASVAETINELKVDLENGQTMTRLINEIFVTAATRRASDIHVVWHKSKAEYCWIRNRVDGDLKHSYQMTCAIAAALTRRLKDMAGMDASEERRSQDGRCSFEYLDRTIDVRVASQPTISGEEITLRLLDPASLRSLAELFPGQEEISQSLSRISAVKGKEGGMVFVTGATSQGKTTTLYAQLRALPRHRLHVVAIEDPVEYEFPFVTQIQFNPFVHASMADCMRGVMREDPDIIVVGEIRDADTAVLSLRAAETGHLILSTLHTPDCYQVYERTMELHPGGEKEALLPFANNFLGSIHQVLSKKVCPHCAVKHDLADDHPLRITHGVVQATKGAGCERCDQEGYHGRVAIPEAIFVSRRDEVRADLVKHLRGGGTLRDLPVRDGIAIYKRQDAVLELLAKGLIDASWATRILGLQGG